MVLLGEQRMGTDGDDDDVGDDEDRNFNASSTHIDFKSISD